MPEKNFWTLWCKGRLTQTDTPTIWLGATPSRLTSAHLHHLPFANTNILNLTQSTFWAKCNRDNTEMFLKQMTWWINSFPPTGQCFALLLVDVWQVLMFCITVWNWRHYGGCSACLQTVLVTGSIARSTNLPVFSLLRGRFWGFSPRRGDTLHRWGEIWHGGGDLRSPPCQISPPSVQRQGCRTPKIEIFTQIWPKCGI